MKPLYIFDLDGTIALIEHRKHWLARVDLGGERWRRFYDACDQDLPNKPVIDTMYRLKLGGADIWVFSGRSEEVRGKTLAWLAQHAPHITHPWEHTIVMRAEGDHRPDDELKQQFLNTMLIEDYERLVGVFDDRDRVVQMWRRNKITCFQVAPGDF